MKSSSEHPAPRPHPPCAFDYLSWPEEELTLEEEIALGRELSAAYHMDERAATSTAVRHLIEKVQARMEGDSLRKRQEDGK